jgi:hypothetical protein
MAEDGQSKGNGAWIKDIILEFANSPENNLGPGMDERAFDDPLIGFARGDDPIFDEFKRHIGEFFWSPAEIFEKTFPESAAKPGELTIISWVLPQTRQTKLDSRREKVYPSERWARNRLFGEQFNAKLRNHVVKVLTGAGYPAVAPGISPLWEMKMSERYGPDPSLPVSRCLRRRDLTKTITSTARSLLTAPVGNASSGARSARSARRDMIRVSAGPTWTVLPRTTYGRTIR